MREEVYERLAAEKREDESFSDTIDRLVQKASSDWRKSFGTLEDQDDELRDIVEEQRIDLSTSEDERQQSVFD